MFIIFFMNWLTRHYLVVGRLRESNSFMMNHRWSVKVFFVVFNGLVICRLKMSGFVMISFLRSGCDGLGLYLLALMFCILAHLFLHIVFFFTNVVSVIVVLTLKFSHCMRIVMRFRGVLSMQD